VLQAILNFLFVAVAVYFVLVAPTNKLAQMRKQGEEAAPEAPSDEILLLTQIRDLLGGADTTVVGPPTGGAGRTTPRPRLRSADHAQGEDQRGRLVAGPRPRVGVWL